MKLLNITVTLLNTIVTQLNTTVTLFNIMVALFNAVVSENGEDNITNTEHNTGTVVKKWHYSIE